MDELDEFFDEDQQDGTEVVEEEVQPAEGQTEVDEQDTEGQVEAREDDSAKDHDGEEEEGDDDYQQAIPRGRFNQVYRQLRDEQARNEELLAENKRLRGDGGQEEQPKTVDIFELEREYMRALLEGEDDEALSIRTKINDEIGRQAEERATRQAIEQISAKEAQKLADAAANEVVDAHPELNTDESLLAELVEWRDFYAVGRGMAPHDAIRAAAKRMFSDQQLETKKDERKAAAIRRNIRESGQQPPAVRGAAGERSIKTGLPESQEEYERMSDEDRKSLLM